MKLSEMKKLLSEREWMLTKSMGQNFLHDQHQLRRIVASADLVKSDKVLEIGPGLGPLTELLAESAGEILAIEKDQRLFEFLREKFQCQPHVKLLHEDALRHVEQHSDWRDWKLVANLPYSVASPILVELAQAAHPPALLVATLQLEVAQRLMAQADDEDYGVLTLLVQLAYEPGERFKIPCECFFPAPKVDSMCVVLRRRATPLLAEDRVLKFAAIVKRAFSQRRKMMLKLLKQDWPADKLTAIFARLNISPQERAEKLTLQQFVQLTLALTS